MSKGLEYIKDISCLIAEYYSDKEPLTEEQKLSKNCFLDYCKYIEQALIKAEQLDKILLTPSDNSTFHFDYKDRKMVCMKESHYNEILRQEVFVKSKKELAFDEFNKYITNLYEHRNDYEKKKLYEFEIDNAVIRASTIEEIYSKFKEVMSDE